MLQSIHNNPVAELHDILQHYLLLFQMYLNKSLLSITLNFKLLKCLVIYNLKQYLFKYLNYILQYVDNIYLKFVFIYAIVLKSN